MNSIVMHVTDVVGTRFANPVKLSGEARAGGGDMG